MDDTKPLRRPPVGGYACGDETRRKIVAAAIRLFGQRGFDGASTRDIASLAGVHAPALQYYFENKEGLYRACAESLADELWQAFEPAVLRAREVLAHDAGSAELIDAFINVQHAVADRTFVNRDETDKRGFFAREQGDGDPEMAFHVLRDGVRAPLNDVNVALLARISGKGASDQLTIVRMLSLYGQVLLFYIARESTLSMLEWDDIDEEKAEFLRSSICAQSRILLEYWSRENKTESRSGCAQSVLGLEAGRSSTAGGNSSAGEGVY